MPRRFALALLTLLLLLLAALLVGRRLRAPEPARLRALPPPLPTAVVPPTPIPARRVAVYFESPEDGVFHGEARDLPDSSDEIALLRSVASAVLDGPRRPDLLRPFPPGWSLRGAYRLRNGLVVLDLAPAASGKEGASPARWEAGTHEEESAAQSLLISVSKNIAQANRVVLLLGGEPAETLGGHIDLGHPIVPDLKRVAEGAPLEPPATPTPVASPTRPPVPPGPSTPSASPAPAGPGNAPSPPARAPVPLPSKPMPRSDTA